MPSALAQTQTFIHLMEWLSRKEILMKSFIASVYVPLRIKPKDIILPLMSLHLNMSAHW